MNFTSFEHTQAEYRWIAVFGHGKHINPPRWGGFDYRVRDKLDSWLDFLLPAICTGLLVVIMEKGI